MISISTHVLDTARGRPAASIGVTLEVMAGGGWRRIAKETTDADGRVKALLPKDDESQPGTYRLTFETGPYHEVAGAKGFYPWVTVVFEIREGGHYHVPLLVSPFGFSTYRGS